MTQSLLSKENDGIEDTVKEMNIIIQDSGLLSNLVEAMLKKRTRLQVMNWINTLTVDEMKQVFEEIYDEAVIASGIQDIEQKQRLDEFHKALDDYEHEKDEI